MSVNRIPSAIQLFVFASFASLASFSCSDGSNFNNGESALGRTPEIPPVTENVVVKNEVIPSEIKPQAGEPSAVDQSVSNTDPEDKATDSVDQEPSTEVDAIPETSVESGPGVTDLKIETEIVDECLRAWIAAGIKEEIARQYTTENVPVTLDNASGVTLFKDHQETEQPLFKIVSIKGRNMNSAIVELFNPNGFYCLHLDAQNMNGFQFRKRSSTKLEILTKQNQNENGFRIVNID